MTFAFGMLLFYAGVGAGFFIACLMAANGRD